jgi:hypothetical protein
MPTVFLFSALLLAFSSSCCLAMSSQEQTVGAAHVQNTVASITAATVPLNHVLPPVKTEPLSVSPVIVIGFLGGNVKKGNLVHREVQLALHLRKQHPDGVYIGVFENSHGQLAFQQIVRLLDTDHNGTLSLAEKKHARIIIYGHSWGASETVTMAHQLDHDGIPVLLTILVDRVPKFGEGDESIPPNVAQAVNFYQTNGLLHGRNTIHAANPADTRILGNYQFDYKNNRVDCTQFPWYARLFMGPHIEIENDPRVWNQVESLIASRLPPEQTQHLQQ